MWIDPWRHPAERKLCLLGGSPGKFNVAINEVDCVRLWCLTASCSSATEDVVDGAAKPHVLVVLLLLLLLLLYRRPVPWRWAFLAMSVLVIAAPFGHALWRAVWIPCAAVCEDNDAEQLRTCESSWLPPLLQLQTRASSPPEAAAWARSALAALDQQPEPHEHDCVIKELECHGPKVPGVVYPALGAIYEDACVALDGNASIIPTSIVFAPTELLSTGSARCRVEAGSHLQQPTASCQPMGTAMMHPCSDRQTMLTARTRFCAVPLPRRPMHRGGRTRVDHAPLLFVEQIEALVHPGNIGHFFRDVSFVASMLQEAQHDGSVVFAPLPPQRHGSEVLGPWQQGLVAAIWRPGGAQPAGSLRDALLAAAAQSQDHSSSSRAERVLCGRRVQRFSTTFGVAHAHAAIHEVTRRVQAHCGKLALSSEKNTTTTPRPEQARRTLLLSLRSGPNRGISNAEEALGLMRLTARVLGLEARATDFGRLTFCEQSAEAATAQVLIGVHGADLANAFLMPSDGTLVEAVPKFDGERGIWHTTTSLPEYAKQMAALGRRYLSVRLLDVNNKSHCGSYSTWMYGGCSARINLSRLNATLEVVRRMYHQHREAHGRGA